jgi:nucleotide-binding universal stress UspA family protein
LITKVLVAIDGSENSIRALDFAVDFVEKFSASLMVLNVSESAVAAVPVDPTGLSSEGLTSFSIDLQKYHEELIAKAIAHAKTMKPSLTISGKLREGNPASEIVAEAKESGFDVIVVGHRGVGKVKEFLGLGGISEKVAKSAPCSIILVR